MRKVILAVILVVAFVLPCFAAETAPASSEEVLEQIAKNDVAKTSMLLLTAGRDKESPVLLAAAAELLKDSEITLKANDGKDISADSIYAEAIAAAKKANNDDLANILDAQSKLESGKHGNHWWTATGWYFDDYYRDWYYGPHYHY